MSLFDKKYNEVWFNILNKPLIFNEQLGRFTSFYTFNPKWSLPISDRVVAIKDNELHTIHDTGVIGLTLWIEKLNQKQLLIRMLLILKYLIMLDYKESLEMVIKSLLRTISQII